MPKLTMIVPTTRKTKRKPISPPDARRRLSSATTVVMDDCLIDDELAKDVGEFETLVPPVFFGVAGAVQAPRARWTVVLRQPSYA